MNSVIMIRGRLAQFRWKRENKIAWFREAGFE
jgi:hypothetical protein